MMEVREVMVLLVMMVAWFSPPVSPQPTIQPLTTLPTTTPTTVSQSSDIGGVTDATSLWQSVLKVDQLLQRPNEYNTLMLESGEEPDQLSRLLYKMQEKQRHWEMQWDMYNMMPRPDVIINNNLQMVHQNRLQVPYQARPMTANRVFLKE
ncbi:uncharacterized protein LOC121856457 [Homarus americanus]|uniref:uncharacterized protein LOC121856457 n=1 Tax=Homarus americanus TaxID=6706 RepID=UPI001C4932A7|nr:uncharacterized protein LOC121856457 [Homarus americanus]XP_042207996.1 uncharacterized protein LOC121856457 [Homarus americanus]